MAHTTSLRVERLKSTTYCAHSISVDTANGLFTRYCRAPFRAALQLNGCGITMLMAFNIDFANVVVQLAISDDTARGVGLHMLQRSLGRAGFKRDRNSKQLHANSYWNVGPVLSSRFRVPTHNPRCSEVCHATNSNVIDQPVMHKLTDKY